MQENEYNPHDSYDEISFSLSEIVWFNVRKGEKLISVQVPLENVFPFLSNFQKNNLHLEESLATIRNDLNKRVGNVKDKKGGLKSK